MAESEPLLTPWGIVDGLIVRVKFLSFSKMLLSYICTVIVTLVFLALIMPSCGPESKWILPVLNWHYIKFWEHKYLPMAVPSLESNCTWVSVEDGLLRCTSMYA